MPKQSLALLLVLVVAAGAPLAVGQPQAAPATPPAPRGLPLAFEPNAGQTDARVRYLAHSRAGLLYFAADEIVLAPGAPVSASRHLADLRDDQQQPPAAGPLLRMHLVGASPLVALAPGDELPGHVNYFAGNDPARWHAGLPTFARLTYRKLYPGIELSYAGDGGQLKGTYTVAPGADPGRIRWRYEGATRVSVDGGGDLQIETGTSAGRITERAPVAWQDAGGRRLPVAARYTMAADGSIAFALGAYDRSLPLVLDPTLVYSTYFGGSDGEVAYRIAIDAAGSIYLAGTTSSPDFPLQAPIQGTYGGQGDAFVSKFSADGQALVYSTYLGGSGQDRAGDVRVDAAGDAYVIGWTESPDFPLQNPFQATFGGGTTDAFVAKLSANGQALVYSTYLGGSDNDRGASLAVDGAGSVYATGVTDSLNFPLQIPFQDACGDTPCADAFVTKFSPDGQALVFSTYLGGNGGDTGYGIAVDATGSAYVTGEVSSTNFPMQNAFQGTNAGVSDAFLTKFDPSAQSLVYSTYLGGPSSDFGFRIALDSTGSVYLTGWANSGFPLQNPFQPTYHGGMYDAFVARFDATGQSLVYSTYLGGSDADQSYDIAVDGTGNAYVVGDTASTDFPLQNPLQSALAGPADAFVTVFTPSGQALVYSTYLGGSEIDYARGIAVGAADRAYLTGFSSSTDFPLRNPFQAYCRGCPTRGDVVIVEIDTAPPATSTPTATPTRTPTPSATPTSTPQPVFRTYVPLALYNAAP